MSKYNLIEIQRNHLMFNAIQLSVSIAHFRKSETFERVGIREQVLQKFAGEFE
jgi:hypothetical protein